MFIFLLFKNSHGFRTLMLCLLKSHTFPVVSGKRRAQLYCIAKGHVISYIETWTHTTHSLVLNITFCYFFFDNSYGALGTTIEKKEEKKKQSTHNTANKFANGMKLSKHIVAMYRVNLGWRNKHTQTHKHRTTTTKNSSEFEEWRTNGKSNTRTK